MHHLRVTRKVAGKPGRMESAAPQPFVTEPRVVVGHAHLSTQE